MPRSSPYIPIAHALTPMGGRIMAPQKCPYPNPQTICICSFIWQRDCAGVIRLRDGEIILNYLVTWVLKSRQPFLAVIREI